MKKNILSVCMIAGLVLLTDNASAQTRTSKTAIAVSPQQLVTYVKEAKQETEKRTYEPIVIRKRIDKSSPLISKTLCANIDKGYKLINKVYAMGNNISSADAIKFNNEMVGIMNQIDKLSSGLQTGNEIPECFAGCDSNYPGTGGGNGWRRFTCKMACLIVETAN